MKKICSNCNKNLDLNDFPKGNSKFEKSSWCKNCHKEYRLIHPENRKQEKHNYYLKQKKLYPWLNSYKNAQQRCINSNRKDYKTYGARDIKFLLTHQECEQLWFRDKAWLLKKPSIDRKDNNGNYELSNCCFIEFNLNVKKAMKQVIRNIKGQFVDQY